MTNDNKRMRIDSMAYRGISGVEETNRDNRIALWQRQRYGMFIHWGPYSVWGGEHNGKTVTTGYSEQIQMWDNMLESEYIQAAPELGTAFDPDAICRLAKEAGMQYIVITSKHHDGFAMFDTDTTDYNIVKQTALGKDPLKLLSDACEKHGLGFGVYFSLVDWHQGHDFDHNNNNTISSSMETVLKEQLRELMTHYGPIVEVWFDMASPTDRQSSDFRKIVRKLQPQAAINSRIWNNAGDFRTLADNQIPSYTLDGPWQTPASIYNETWGYRRWQVRDDLSGKVRHLVESLVRVRARGGNYLLNIGLRGDGSIVPFEADVLKQIGDWVHHHHKAIIDAQSTRFDRHEWGELTYGGSDLFLHVTEGIPDNRELLVKGLVSNVNKVVDDSTNEPLSWHMDDVGLTVVLPDKEAEDLLPVIRVELEDELCIIPAFTVKERDGSWLITDDDLYDGRGFKDSGNYNTLAATTVRKTAFITNHTPGKVTLRFKGNVNDETRRYHVQVGEEMETVTGKRLLTSTVGPFKVESETVVPLHITLADAVHMGEALGLNIEAITLEKE